MGTDKQRCDWCEKDDLYRSYHDDIWGVPQYDDRVLFEYLNLEGAQAGLSWYTILKRIESYRQAFDHWDVERISQYTDEDRQRLLSNPGIIRNKLKVEAVIQNAKAFLKMKKEEGSFSQFLWAFVDGKPIINHWRHMDEIPANSKISDEMSRALKAKGFKFCGSTICYAFMQATGMVDDHLLSCWKRSNG